MSQDTAAAAPAAPPARTPRRSPTVRLPAPASLSSARRALPWRRILTSAGAVWLATRLAYLVISYCFPLATGPESPQSTSVSLAGILGPWAHWDGIWYIQIARYGYAGHGDTAFFPLYPATIRLFAFITAGNWVIAALLASQAGALLAFTGVALLAAQVAPAGEEARRARLAVTLFAAYPLSLFLFAPYSDGMFAGLATLSLFFGLRRRWGRAALCGLLAALCRPMGLALIAPLAWEALEWYRYQRATTHTRIPVRDAAPVFAVLLAPIAGIGLYSLYLSFRFGDPLRFIHAESAWTHTLIPPFAGLALAMVAFSRTPLFSMYQARVLLDLLPLTLAVIALIPAARRMRLSLTLYLVSVLAIITAEPVLHIDLYVSAGRYLLAATPLFILMGAWLRRSSWLLPVYLWTGVLLQAFLALYFLRNGYMI